MRPARALLALALGLVALGCAPSVAPAPERPAVSDLRIPLAFDAERPTPHRFVPPTPACALLSVRIITHPPMDHPLPMPAHADTLVVWECPGLRRSPGA